MTAHRTRMRCTDGIVHDVRPWRATSTACGTVVFDIPKESDLRGLGIYAYFRIVGSGPVVDDPIDCMTCLAGRRTPYAVLCEAHGQQFLTEEQYAHQMSRPDALWRCPRCGESAYWDDDEYDITLDEGCDDDEADRQTA